MNHQLIQHPAWRGRTLLALVLVTGLLATLPMAGWAANENRALASANAAAVTGSRKVAVMLINFTNNTREPWTQEFVEGVLFGDDDSLKSYYRDASYELLDVSADVFGWYTIPYTDQECAYPPTDWADAADAAATAAGVSLSEYQYKIYAFPTVPSCRNPSGGYWPGANLGPRIWVNGWMTVDNLAHELGHAFGLKHASAVSCERNGISVTLLADLASCTHHEYGDPFSVMGDGWFRRLHHAGHRFQLGWLPDAQIVTTSGLYMLAPSELGPQPGSLRLLRVPRSDNTYVDLEFRQPFGGFDNFAASDPVIKGVTLRIHTFGNMQSKLLDATPDTARNFKDGALAEGRLFVDPLTGMRITTLSASPGGARVLVRLGPDLVETGVSASVQRTLNRVSWSIGDTVTNSGGSPATTSTTRYYLSQDKWPSAGDILLGARSVPLLNPGESSTGTLTGTYTGTISTGTYEYVVACADNLRMVPEAKESNNCTASPTRTR